MSSERSTPGSRDAPLPGPSRQYCFVLPAPERYSAASGGAIATVTRQLARALSAAGHGVTVLTPDDGTPMYSDGEVRRLRFGPAVRTPDAVHKAYVLEGRLRRWSWPEYGQYLRQVMRALGSGRRPDTVVVANDAELAHHLHRRGVGSRQVLWLHNQLEGPETRRIADLPPGVAVVAVSDFIRRWTMERYGLPTGRIAVIHNGIDGREFHPRPGYEQPRSPVRVICHGRIDPNKSHDVAASAVAELRRRGTAVTFTLMGGVKTFGIPEDQVQAYTGLLDRAVGEAEGTALGMVPATAVAEVLREHDVACVLSKGGEPFSLAALESMASGCAVVTTGDGGIGELVGDAALLVGIDDTRGVADAIDGLVRDPGRLADRKRSVRLRSEAFSWESAAAALEQLAVAGEGR